jgi:PST family polysaccharide transporter
MTESRTTGEITGSTRRLALGAIASGVVNLIKVGLQLLLLPVMARLLGPTEFGIYALAMPTVTLVTLLADGGLGATLAREPESASLIWSSAFWFLLMTGIVLALGTSLFGLVMGHLVSQPRIVPMIAVLSISIVFLVLAVPPSARLVRRKHLGTFAAAELAATLAGAAVAIFLALTNSGAWSLIAQYLTVFAIRTVFLNFAAFDPPKLEFSFAIVRSHLVSGGLIVMTRLADYASRVGENIVVDRVFGTSVLGGYTFANQISKFAGEAVGNVTWAALYVQAVTGERSHVAEVHHRLCRLVAEMLFPVTFMAAAAAPELVDLLLGPQWTALTPMLRVLLPIAGLMVVANQVTAILLAVNRFDIAFWCAFGLSVGRVAAVASGAWIGLLGAVYGIAVVNLGYIVVLMIYAAPPTGCRPIAMLRGLLGPTIASLAAAATCLLVLRLGATTPLWTAASLALGVGAFAGCLWIIDRKGLSEDLETARRIMTGHKIAVKEHQTRLP